MVKKDFTEERPKQLNNMSDVDLIERLDKGTISPAEINVIKAILDKRNKKSIQYLTEVIQKSSEKTEKYNKALVTLTRVIAFLTFLMLIGLGIQIWLSLSKDIIIRDDFLLFGLITFGIAIVVFVLLLIFNKKVNINKNLKNNNPHYNNRKEVKMDYFKDLLKNVINFFCSILLIWYLPLTIIEKYFQINVFNNIPFLSLSFSLAIIVVFTSITSFQINIPGVHLAFDTKGRLFKKTLKKNIDNNPTEYSIEFHYNKIKELKELNKEDKEERKEFLRINKDKEKQNGD